jgi:hypothetical protein
LAPGAGTGARIDGDAALGTRVLANLAFMIRTADPVA